MHGMQLYGPEGQRKYLTPGERDDFLTSRQVRTFCATLAYTGMTSVKWLVAIRDGKPQNAPF